MTSKKHNFQELIAPSEAADKLGISVATLRKYSLIVEKITGDDHYYERTKQRARLYRKQDVQDLDAFHKLAKEKGLTLKEAARQIYAVSDVKQKPKDKKTNNELLDTSQMAKLLAALQQTIATQNTAIDNLQKQLNRIEKQNEELLKKQAELPAHQADNDIEVDPKIAAMPDISGVVKPKTREEKRHEIEQDSHKSEHELHSEILAKARENAKKSANAAAHRTLADMQLPPKKEHWWQRFLNY